MSKEQFDKILSKWISRKLLVFIISTIALFSKFITSTDWIVIAGIYLGTETAISIITEHIKNKA